MNVSNPTWGFSTLTCPFKTRQWGAIMTPWQSSHCHLEWIWTHLGRRHISGLVCEAVPREISLSHPECDWHYPKLNERGKKNKASWILTLTSLLPGGIIPLRLLLPSRGSFLPIHLPCHEGLTAPASGVTITLKPLSLDILLQQWGKQLTQTSFIFRMSRQRLRNWNGLWHFFRGGRISWALRFRQDLNLDRTCSGDNREN